MGGDGCDALCQVERGLPISPYTPTQISPISPLRLPCISPTSPLHLPDISSASPKVERGFACSSSTQLDGGSGVGGIDACAPLCGDGISLAARGLEGCD